MPVCVYIDIRDHGLSLLCWSPVGLELPVILPVSAPHQEGHSRQHTHSFSTQAFRHQTQVLMRSSSLMISYLPALLTFLLVCSFCCAYDSGGFLFDSFMNTYEFSSFSPYYPSSTSPSLTETTFVPSKSPVYFTGFV